MQADLGEGVMVDMPDPCSFLRLESGRDFSRLLYSNPVCFLTSKGSAASQGQCENQTPEWYGRHNVMTISWLTAINNHGLLAFSINKARFSKGNLSEVGGQFVLSVPPARLKSLVLAVGKISGRRGDKFADPSLLGHGLVKIPLPDDTENDEKKAKHSVDRSASVRANSFAALQEDSEDNSESSEDMSWREPPGRETSLIDQPQHCQRPRRTSHESDSPQCVTVLGCVAWMRCNVVSVVDDVAGDVPYRLPPSLGSGEGTTSQHSLVIAQICEAAVDERYWDGKTFALKSDIDEEGVGRYKSHNLGPHLTFLGSQEFGVVTRLPAMTVQALSSGNEASIPTEKVQMEERDVTRSHYQHQRKKKKKNQARR